MERKEQSNIIVFVAKCEDCKWMAIKGTQSKASEDVNYAMDYIKMMAKAHNQWYPQHNVKITTARG